MEIEAMSKVVYPTGSWGDGCFHVEIQEVRR